MIHTGKLSSGETALFRRYTYFKANDITAQVISCMSSLVEKNKQMKILDLKKNHLYVTG